MLLARAVRVVLLLTLLLGVAAALNDRFNRPLEGIAEAIDGDSLRLGAEEIRLAGIDAPEFRQSCGVKGRETPCGRLARQALVTLLRAGPVSCRGEGRDKYDRLLARCEAAGRNVAAAMVRQGLAVSDGAYLFEEAAAQKEKRGIWAGPFQPPAEWRKDNKVGPN